MSLIFLKYIYKIDNSILRFASLPKGNARITVFNLLGKEVMNASFTTNGIKHISLPKLARGTYNVRIKQLVIS
jgi:putative heme iron utilization protein